MAQDQGPVLDQVNIIVKDMVAMVAFYRRLGMPIDEMDGPWNLHHRTAALGVTIDVELDSGQSARLWNESWPEGAVGAMLGFRVADRDEVDRLFNELVAVGAPVRQSPYDAFWGSRYAIVEDPDGNAVGLMSPTDPARRSAPPALPQ